jgi:hypothetical protein
MSGATLPLAHFGHVLVDLPIFAGPVFVLVAWLVWTSLRSRKG